MQRPELYTMLWSGAAGFNLVAK